MRALVPLCIFLPGKICFVAYFNFGVLKLPWMPDNETQRLVEEDMGAAKTLTKADFSRHLMERLELTKKDADLLVSTFFKSIVSALGSGEGVEMRGFGSFRPRSRKPRAGRNPRNGESVQVPSKRVAYFKLGKELRAKLVDGQSGQAI
jgi:integration host factor subunit beta